MAAKPSRQTWGNPYDHSEKTRTCWSESSWYEGRPRNSTHEFICDWCGQTKQRLYSYGNETKKFCDKDCERSFNT